MILDIQSFLSLRSQRPVIDVRSESEYEAGHIAQAINIPLLNNAERIEVGTDYKHKGQFEAIRTGFRLVGPRLGALIDEVKGVGDEVLVYCWRGGMRSVNFCQFVTMAGVRTGRLDGGYKAYRQLMLATFAKPLQLVVIGGCTGAGKSEILRSLARRGEQIIDLEALAHHKGSAFGGLMQPPQPTTEQFHNNLFETLMTLDLSRRIWIEDESMSIGKNILPGELWEQMKRSPVVEVSVERPLRVQRLVQEYGDADKDAFLQAMQRITRKLGGQHFNLAKEKLAMGDMASTIDILLNYYDKAYTRGLEGKRDRIRLSLPWDGQDVDAFAAGLTRELDKLPAMAI